jgi:hypothetical protein
MPGASKSAAVQNTVASFMENLLLLPMYLLLVEGLDAASASIHYFTSSGFDPIVTRISEFPKPTRCR